MTKTVKLTEHGDPSEPLQLDQIDVDWIEQENEKEEKRHNRGLKKLELINSHGRFKLKAKGHVGSISLPSRKFIFEKMGIWGRGKFKSGDLVKFLKRLD